MGAGTAPLADADAGEWQIKIIVDNEQLVRRINFVPVAQRRYRLPTKVHIGLWFYQNDPLPVNDPFGKLTISPLLTKRQAVTLGQCFNTAKTNIVTGSCITFTWIAQANNEPHVLYPYQ
jgi:hypothetical protein